MYYVCVYRGIRCTRILMLPRSCASTRNLAIQRQRVVAESKRDADALCDSLCIEMTDITRLIAYRALHRDAHRGLVGFGAIPLDSLIASAGPANLQRYLKLCSAPMK